MAIVVRNEQITVRAPYPIPHYAIYNFVQEKSDWIEKKISEQKKKAAEVYLIATGQHIPIMGTLVLIKTESARKNDVSFQSENLVIKGKNLTPLKTTQLFNKWLKNKASTELSIRTWEVSQKLGISGKLRNITLRKTKTKWGHCTSQGNIQYNWQIIMAPENVINYIVAHEVSHLVHMNHSSYFWALVESIEPDYRQARTWLKDNGHKLMLK
ncbi:MAG: M48 family metallopeptidase [Gammaproteobacteria bacterium]|nr:M48 family metallopeptidase [Gammaproteobacteria bacterium]